MKMLQLLGKKKKAWASPLGREKRTTSRRKYSAGKKNRCKKKIKVATGLERLKGFGENRREWAMSWGL